VVQRSSEVSGYIAAAAPFARPLLKHLRALFLRADPRMQETIKWGAPFFELEGIVGSISAFQRHVSLGFWKGDELRDPQRVFDKVGRTQMAMARFERVDDLPSDRALLDLIRQAVELNEAAVQKPRRATKARRRRAAAPKVPADLAKGLARSSHARATFEAFSPAKQRAYVDWIEKAVRPQTRERRLAQTLEWLAEGKSRNWKYR
jgi:hypothetical protein